MELLDLTGKSFDSFTFAKLHSVSIQSLPVPIESSFVRRAQLAEGEQGVTQFYETDVSFPDVRQIETKLNIF